MFRKIYFKFNEFARAVFPENNFRKVYFKTSFSVFKKAYLGNILPGDGYGYDYGVDYGWGL